MPRPPQNEPFESARMKIRRGTLAQTNRVRAHEDEGPAEPDEIFDVDPFHDHEPAAHDHEQPAEASRRALDDTVPG